VKERAAKRPAAERKRMILESALAVFAASGYANAGVEEVARAAGVAPSAIYRHFPSKRELYLAVLRDAGARLLATWTESAEAIGDPLQTVWQIGMDYYDHVQTRSTYARLFFQALGDTSDEDVRAAIAGNYLAMVDAYAGRLADAQSRGIVRTDVDPRIMAWHSMAIGFTFDLVNHLSLDDELDRPRVEDWGHLYIESIRENAHGTGQTDHREPGGALPVRQPRGESHARRGRDPLSAMPADPPHPLEPGGNRNGSP
jgi:AcrR family transcriptional regulator